MAFLQQTLPNPLNTQESIAAAGKTRWLRMLAALVVIGFIGAAGWAGLRLANTTNVTNESAAQTLPVRTGQAAPQPPTGQAPQSQPGSVPAAAMIITTTHVTPSLVVIAGTAGATLLDMPGGTALQTVTIGTTLNATGRSDDLAWLYASSTAGTTGWVATDQVIAFGVEKLAILSVPVAVPAPFVESDVISATGALSTATTDVTETVPTATEPIVAAVAGANEPVDATLLATVTVTGARLNVRAGAGTSYGIVGKVSAGDQVIVLARNAANDWVKIAAADTSTYLGWVAVAYLRLNIPVANLPISAEPSAAPAAATVAAPVAAPVAGTSTIQTVATPVAVTQPVALPVVAASTPAPESMSQVVTSQIAAQAGNTASVATGLSGTLVFQASPGGMIYAYDLAAGRLWQLTNGFDPAISTDGQTVAFVRTAGENGIYLINIDGSNERLIFSGRSTLAGPKWSPDGAYILFTRGDEYKECRDLGRGLCLTDKELLSQNPNFPVDTFPLIKVYESNLARVDVHGGNYRDIANLETARAADWNEAGIVYQSTAGLQITADAPDATTQLVAHDAYRPAYEDPDWQPNGGRIVYVGRQSNHREIFAVNPDGSNIVALTKPVTTLVDELPSNVAPAWSPDGQHIVFLSNRAANYSAGAWQLWVMNADGSNQQPLPITVPLTYNFGNEQVVSWGR